MQLDRSVPLHRKKHASVNVLLAWNIVQKTGPSLRMEDYWQSVREKRRPPEALLASVEGLVTALEQMWLKGEGTRKLAISRMLDVFSQLLGC